MELRGTDLPEIRAKVIFYGPGLSGKSTNIRYLSSLQTNRDKQRRSSIGHSIEFHKGSQEIPEYAVPFGACVVRLQLFSVPMSLFYSENRLRVIRDICGVVFVADSQEPRMQANLECLSYMREDFHKCHLALDKIPLVLQYNKQDVESACSTGRLRELLNPQYQYFDIGACAKWGIGVAEPVEVLAQQILVRMGK